MGQILSEILNDISDGRERRAMKTMFDKILNDDATATHKAIIFGAAATPISIAEAFTTGIEISADGTTAISVTSGFTGTTGISFAGTATDGILISGVCVDGIHISGASSTNGINISGAEAVGISINTSTPTDGILVSAACANSVSLTGASTTCINFGTPTGSIFKLIADDTIVSDANQALLVDISSTANAGFIKVVLDTSTVKYIALYDAKTS